MGFLEPDVSNNVFYLQSCRRNAFQMHWCDPDAPHAAFGFPPQTIPAYKQLGQVPAAGAPGGNNRVGWSGADCCVSVGECTSWYASDCSGGNTPGCPPTPFVYRAPYQWDLTGPTYIVMQLRQPDCGSTEHNVHAYKEDRWSIIAKLMFPISATHQTHISEELIHTSFPGPVSIDKLQVQFLTPEGRPVDFNGREHSFSLLFVLEQGYVTERCY